MKVRIIFFILLIISAGLIYSSCSEGIFNFNDETGNVSIKFTVDSAVSENLQNVVFNLENNSGDSIRKDLEISDHDGSQSAECYISRIDTGLWTLDTTVYNESGAIAAERNDSFELALAQTVIAEMTYYSGGGIDVDWEIPAGSELESLLDLNRFNALIAAYHIAGNAVEDSNYMTVLIAEGSNLYSALSRFSIEFPDNSFFEYSSSRSTGMSNIQVEISSEYLSIQRDGYYTKGNYTLTAEDPNGVETVINDYCSFSYDAYNGFATLNSNFTVFDGTSVLSDRYDKNNSYSAGCYILYIVDAFDGTNVLVDAGAEGCFTVIDDPSTAGDINLWTADEATGASDTYYSVLVTIDADIDDATLEDAYTSSGTPNLLPDNFPLWLYSNFPDQINIIALSVKQETT